MTRTIEPPEAQAADEFEYLGHRIRLHPLVTEIGTPRSEDNFQTLSVVLEGPARIIRLMHHAWGPDVLDHYKAFERGMRRRSKKGQARWMKYDPAVDKVDYATWYLNRWIEFLDKTPAIYLFEPRSAKCFEKMPEAKPEANAEPMPEGGLFNIF